MTELNKSEQTQQVNKCPYNTRFIIIAQDTQINIPKKLLTATIKNYNNLHKQAIKAGKFKPIEGKNLSVQQLVLLSQSNETLASHLLKLSFEKLVYWHHDLDFFAKNDPESLSIYIDEEPAWQFDLKTHKFYHPEINEIITNKDKIAPSELPVPLNSVKYFLVYNVYASLSYRILQYHPQLAKGCLTSTNNKATLRLFLPKHETPLNDSPNLLNSIAKVYQEQYDLKLLNNSRLAQLSFAEILDLCEASTDLQQKLFDEVVEKIKQSIKAGKKPQQKLDLTEVNFTYPLKGTDLYYSLFFQLLFKYFADNKEKALQTCRAYPALAQFVYSVAHNALLGLANPLTNHSVAKSPTPKSVKKHSKHLVCELIEQQPKFLTKVIESPSLFTRLYGQPNQTQQLLSQINRVQSPSSYDELQVVSIATHTVLAAIEKQRPYSLTYKFLKFVLDKTGINLSKTKLAYYEAYLALKKQQLNEANTSSHRRLSLTPVKKSKTVQSTNDSIGILNFDGEISPASRITQETTMVFQEPQDEQQERTDNEAKTIYSTLFIYTNNSRRKTALQDGESISADSANTDSTTSSYDDSSAKWGFCNIL